MGKLGRKNKVSAAESGEMEPVAGTFLPLSHSVVVGQCALLRREKEGRQSVWQMDQE